MAFLHIDPLGNDTTGDGSQALPYATPSKAHSVSVPSGTVYYHAGTYNILLEQDLAINGAANQFITHQPYVSGGNIDTVILDGALGVFSSTQNIIRLSGNRIIFDGIQRGKMTLRNNPGGRGISINSSQFCQIKNLIVHNVQERPIGGGGHNYLIENCEVYQGGLGHVSGIVAAWPGGIAPTSLGTGILASNITITGCYVHDHWGEGIILLRATGITVIGNVVHDCFSVGIYIDKAIVGIVDSNYIFTSNPGYVRAGIGNMRLINIAQEGVAVFNPNREIRIRNNILAGGSTALRYFQDATTGTVFNYYAGIHIDHNTIWRPDGYAFDFDNVTAPNPEPTGNAFRNNIVFKGTGGSMVMNASDYAGMLFQNNCFADFTPTFATGTNSIFNTNPNLINPALSGSVNGFAVNFLSVVARAGLNLTSTIPRDFFGKTRSSTPTIGAYEVPPPPTGTNDTYTVAKNTLLTQAASPSGVFVNDYLNMSGTLHGFNALSTQGGTVYVSGSGAFTYNPPNGFYGTDTFKYTIISMGGTGSATVSVLVSNVLPSLVDDSYTGNQGIALGVPALGVFANDILNSGTLIGYATATTQAGSVLFGVSGAFTYTPAGGFFSPPVDTFRYTVQNNIGTGTATVSITVNATEAGSPSGTTSSLMAWQRYRSWYRWNRI